MSPTVQSWGASPRIVVTFADESGIDDGSLSITLDRDAGSLTAGTNLADRAVVRADGVAIIALGADDALAVGAVELTARVSDRAGNEATASRTFAVTVDPRAAPSVDVTVDPASGEAPLTARFEASGVAGGDGAILSWEWVFGDGATATGRSVAHTFEAAGSYDVRVRAVDDTGAVGEAVARVEVRPCVGECGPPDAGPAPAIDAAVSGSDAGADGGATPDDRVPARGGCAVTASTSRSWAPALALSLAAWGRRRRRR